MNAVTVLSVTQDRRDRLVESQRNLQSKKKTTKKQLQQRHWQVGKV